MFDDDRADELRIQITERAQHVKDLRSMSENIQTTCDDLDVNVVSMTHSCTAMTEDIMRLRETAKKLAETLTSSQTVSDIALILQDAADSHLRNAQSAMELTILEEQERINLSELARVAEAEEQLRDQERESKLRHQIEKRKLQNQIRELKMALSLDYCVPPDVRVSEPNEIHITKPGAHIDLPYQPPTDHEDDSPQAQTTVTSTTEPFAKRVFNNVIGTMTRTTRGKRDDKVVQLEAERAVYYQLKKESQSRQEIIAYLKKLSGVDLPPRWEIRKRSEQRKKDVVSRHTLDHFRVILEDLLKHNMQLEDEICMLKKKFAV